MDNTHPLEETQLVDEDKYDKDKAKALSEIALLGQQAKQIQQEDLGQMKVKISTLLWEILPGETTIEEADAISLRILEMIEQAKETAVKRKIMGILSKNTDPNAGVPGHYHQDKLTRKDCHDNTSTLTTSKWISGTR